MFGLKKRAPTHDEKLQETLVLPVDLNEAHSYAVPDVAHNDYPAKLPYGQAQYSDQLGTDLPTIANQDAILVHWFKPPADKNPQEWYNDRNESELFRSKQELFQTKGWSESTDNQDNVAQNPWLSTPRSPRPTSTQSPSIYRFLRPFDQRWQKTFNGMSGSMASLGKQYALGGMQPQNRLRNTLRMEPTRWDIEQFDTNAGTIPAATPAVIVSPSANWPSESQFWGIR